MSDDEFKPGLFAKLKCGGPEMGVVSVEDDGVRCTWFEGKRLHEKVFPRTLLELLKPPTPVGDIRIRFVNGKGNTASTGKLVGGSYQPDQGAELDDRR